MIELLCLDESVINEDCMSSFMSALYVPISSGGFLSMSLISPFLFCYSSLRFSSCSIAKFLYYAILTVVLG